jgi:hypothetical protein
VLADAKWWRRLLTRSGWPPWCGRRSWSGRNHHRRRNRDDLLLVIVVLVVVINLDDNADLDFDLVGVVQFDGVTLEHLGGGGLGLFLVGVDGGVYWFLGHSGSYVTDR